jgi:fructokinase
MTIFGAIETGGTKILARVFDGAGTTLSEGRWETRDGQGAGDDLIPFLGQHGAPAALGMAAFGPINIDPASPDYGQMQPTTKPGWTGVNVAKRLADQFGCPIAVDSDVNAAALGEARLGAGRDFDPVCYVTVGTGIGGGLYREGATYRGVTHPEVGHVLVQRGPGDVIDSVCGYHDHCAEGLASGPAVRRRLDGRELSEAPEIAAQTADYLAQLLIALTLTWSPQKIVMGGGVMTAEGMLPRVRQSFAAKLGGYGVGDAAPRADYIVAAALENAGLEGAAIMARELLKP